MPACLRACTPNIMFHVKQNGSLTRRSRNDRQHGTSAYSITVQHRSSIAYLPHLTFAPSHLRITQFGWIMTGAMSRSAKAGVAFPSMSSLGVGTECTAMATFQSSAAQGLLNGSVDAMKTHRLMHQKPEARAQ